MSILLYAKKKTEKFFNHIITQISIIIGAVFVLFSSDVEVVFIPHSYAIYIFYVRNFWMIFFIIEFTLSNTVEPGFPFSLYFFIDFIDLLSLATETTIIWGPIFDLIDQSAR